MYIPAVDQHFIQIPQPTHLMINIRTLPSCGFENYGRFVRKRHPKPTQRQQSYYFDIHHVILRSPLPGEDSTEIQNYVADVHTDHS